MGANLKEKMVTREVSRPASAEQRLQELGIKLPAPPERFGTYVEAVQTADLLETLEVNSKGRSCWSRVACAQGRRSGQSELRPPRTRTGNGRQKKGLD
jgi:hypothetical protein